MPGDLGYRGRQLQFFEDGDEARSALQGHGHGEADPRNFRVSGFRTRVWLSGSRWPSFTEGLEKKHFLKKKKKKKKKVEQKTGHNHALSLE
jgi:hypothetical protein